MLCCPPAIEFCRLKKIRFLLLLTYLFPCTCSTEVDKALERCNERLFRERLNMFAVSNENLSTNDFISVCGGFCDASFPKTTFYLTATYTAAVPARTAIFARPVLAIHILLFGSVRKGPSCQAFCHMIDYARN